MECLLWIKLRIQSLRSGSIQCGWGHVASIDGSWRFDLSRTLTVHILHNAMPLVCKNPVTKRHFSPKHSREYLT